MSIPTDQLEVEVVKYTYEMDDPDVTRVTLRVTGRNEGLYTCSISQFRVERGLFNTSQINTTTANVTVTETPVNINATRTDEPHHGIYWALPTSGEADFEYEVFYRVAGNSTILRYGTKTVNPNIKPNLNLSLEYVFIVVADGPDYYDLPSVPINITLPECKCHMIKIWLTTLVLFSLPQSFPLTSLFTLILLLLAQETSLLLPAQS